MTQSVLIKVTKAISFDKSFYSMVISFKKGKSCLFYSTHRGFPKDQPFVIVKS